MLLPRKMLTLHLRRYTSSLRGARCSEAVGCSLGKWARQGSNKHLIINISWVAVGGSTVWTPRDARQEPLSSQHGLGAAGSISLGCAQPHSQGNTVQVLSPNPSFPSCTKHAKWQQGKRKGKGANTKESVLSKEMWIIKLKIICVPLSWTACWLTGGAQVGMKTKPLLHINLQFLPALFHEAPACCKGAVL